MFTGIVTAIGTVTRAETKGPSLKQFDISCPWEASGIELGASICCAGVCLTVTALRPREDGEAGCTFQVETAAETLAKTRVAEWAPGTKVNLERSLKMGDELGGHLVTGHVDGVGTVVGVCPDGGSLRIGIAAPSELGPYIAPKGSITLDGVSLTVNEVKDEADGTTHFAVNIIPHTAQHTTLGDLAPGDAANIEIDVLARYLKRLRDAKM